MGLKIGELARATGTTAPTIRYYEQIGLLPAARRVGGQRRYGDADVRRLTFIRRCRDFGFPVEQVRILASLTDDREHSCREARSTAQKHLAAIRQKLGELQSLEHRLAEFIRAADTTCSGGTGADCPVLDELAEPLQCC